MTIVVTTLPSAIISGTTSVCENGAQPNITFTGSNSTAPYTFTYSINGGANQTITTSPTSAAVTLPVPTATTGTFTYTLSNVAVGACSSAVTAQAATITVSANIIPTFTQVGRIVMGRVFLHCLRLLTIASLGLGRLLLTIRQAQRLLPPTTPSRLLQEQGSVPQLQPWLLSLTRTPFRSLRNWDLTVKGQLLMSCR